MTVAQDRSATNQIGLRSLFVQCLDDQFLFALDCVHQQPKFAFAHRDHEHEDFFRPAVWLLFGWTPQASYRQDRVAQLQNFAVVDLMDVSLVGASDLSHRIQRNGIQTLFDPEQQGFDDGECQWQLQAECGPLPRAAEDVYRALEAMQDALHDVQTNAAAGNFGDLIRSAESRAEDEIHNVRFAEPAGFFPFQQTSFYGSRLDLLRVDAAAVVADFHDDLIALMVSLETDGSLGRFTSASALFGAFNAVSNRIPNQVRHWFGDGIQQALVQGSVLPIQNQIDLLVTLLGHVSNHAGKSPEQLLDRHHPDLHHGTLQIIQHSRLEGHGIGEAPAHGFLGIAHSEFVERLLQHGFPDNQLAYEIEYGVDALGIHAQYVLRGRGGWPEGGFAFRRWVENGFDFLDWPG